ncbi:NrdJb [Oleiphilus sp. HI0009]|uniref:TSCPD domain-containing protein n=1 Tax=unclassified Oleiphilus TaxID=2631174 RepID=UPI0007C24B0C|nr:MULTISPECIES: NrdJb [unclassified Oleiphilus]KZX77541.1 NrdJb [Oleiphilus sp. HI0009]KZY62560.1 NrdJb [Oleiphilus sp. HI0066]KZY69544.1 NrdJb [Oleiphilus sp. HI0067]
MAIKIEKKIVGYQVHTDASAAIKEAEVEQRPKPIEMNEKIERPDFLLGSTYKVKTPVDEHALYITINDIILNEDTDHEVRRPYEVFINSKSMEHFQWVIALTRVISAVFRKGGDITFLVEELSSVYDPNGGYYKKGGVFMPSLVAEIGAVIEKHMKSIGLIESEEMSDTTKQILAEKRAEFEQAAKANTAESSAKEEPSPFPDTAQLCKKCNTKAVIIMDGCATCLNCGDSKCG